MTKKKTTEETGREHPAVYPTVTVVDDEVMTTSLNVAGVFKKKHKNVLQAIQSVDNDDEFGRLNFQPSSYINEQGKNQVMYNMTRAGFTLLAMGFTGLKARKFKIDYIDAFDRMEAELAEHARAIPPPGGDSEELRRTNQTLGKALDALLSAQDQATLSKALDALLASQGQGGVLKDIEEKVKGTGNLARSHFPSIGKKLDVIAGYLVEMDRRLNETAAIRQGEDARFIAAQAEMSRWLDRIEGIQEDQIQSINRIVQIQDEQSRITRFMGSPDAAHFPDLAPVVKVMEGMKFVIENRMMEVTHLTTRIKQLDDKIDKVARGIPPQGGISGYMAQNLPKERIGVPLITSITDNQNSPETFIDACMVADETASIPLRFLYRVYSAWTYERYSMPIVHKTFKARLIAKGGEIPVSIKNVDGFPHLMGMRLKPGIIDPVR